VHGAAPEIVCPTRHEVADVDDECVGHGQNFVPGTVWLLNFETARVVLGKQDGERAVVAVGASPKLAGLRGVLLRWVVDGAKGADG